MLEAADIAQVPVAIGMPRDHGGEIRSSRSGTHAGMRGVGQRSDQWLDGTVRALAVDRRRSVMKSRNCLVLSVLGLLIVAGCASTKVTSQEPRVTERLPRPETIWVYDFVATPADMPADSSLAGQYEEPATPQTAEQIATGRKLGAQIATQLVEEIRSWKAYGEASGGSTVEGRAKQTAKQIAAVLKERARKQGWIK
jgi:hypothetical protein